MSENNVKLVMWNEIEATAVEIQNLHNQIVMLHNRYAALINHHNKLTQDFQKPTLFEQVNPLYLQ